MQMIMPLDEKNHVISNANEELSRHTRRQDEIWPRIAEEISEETRLGSLRHWALTDLNPTKKTQAAAARGREAAATMLPDNEVAERSERRREAMALAKKQKATQQVDSDAEARKGTRKGFNARKGQEIEDALATVPVTMVGNIPSIRLSKAKTAANKKLSESAAKTATPSSVGGVAMSRETSQQDNTKKRKAPTLATTTARKRYVKLLSTLNSTDEHYRINAATNDSPKLGHSPLAGTFGKDAKRSPALSHVRPVNGRGRQNSAQASEPSNRPSSAASRRNGVTATGSDLERVGVATGKTINEVRHTMREITNSKGERIFEEDVPDTVDNRMRGGILLERSASKSSLLKREANLTDGTSGRRTASPRLSALETGRGEKNGKSKAKTSTPVLGSFADPDTSESAQDAASFAENLSGNGTANDSSLKPKRQARPRIKDHHGLHDSLSPKGLPTKRTHKKNGSYSLAAALSTRKDREDDAPAIERKPNTSRTNSRSAKNNSITDTARDSRNASSTPRITGLATEFVDEPDSLPSAASEDLKHNSSRRQSQNHKHSSSYHHLDVKPPGTTSSISRVQASPKLKSETPLGSPGPEEHDIQIDGDAGLDDEEEDPNEQRYCYCNGVSYGEMVACDNENCAREWFHLECTGLRSLQAARSTWYCDECKASMAR